MKVDMKYRLLSGIYCLVFCVSCNHSTSDNSSNVTKDYQGIEEDSSLVSESDAYDWTPEEFKKEHHDEWVVVKHSIDIQQREGDTDFSQIDKLVKDYIVAQKIDQPKDKTLQIKKISEICASKFDIDGYDGSNMGEHIADGTRRLFDMYVNWLYEQEAKKVLEKTKIVDIKKELELYKNLYDATYNLCDSVEGCMGGSGGWVAFSQLHDLTICYEKLMYQVIIGSPIKTGKELDVPLEVFDKECTALIANYEPYEDDPYEDEQPKEVAPIVNKYNQAYHSWYEYRKSVASKMSNKKFKEAYNSITYSYPRIYLLHLKNRFSDIGLMSNDMFEVCLDEDCSNKELLEFNYEEKYKELFGDL